MNVIGKFAILLTLIDASYRDGKIQIQKKHLRHHLNIFSLLV